MQMGEFPTLFGMKPELVPSLSKEFEVVNTEDENSLLSDFFCTESLKKKE